MRCKILVLISLIFFSCNSTRESDLIDIDKDLQINLKWYKSYKSDTFEKNKIALSWFLSYLGANEIITKHQIQGIRYNNTTITIQIDLLGFTKEAIGVLKEIHKKIKVTEAYKTNDAIDIGRYMALILGDSNYYYAITGISTSLNTLKQQYNLKDSLGYINNSSVSKVHRKIAFSNYTDNSQLFISTEIDPETKEPLEFETVEIMKNGQLLFGLFDIEGNLKVSADTQVTRAGKPGKCIWCHEVNIHPLFRGQQNVEGYLSATELQNVLKGSNEKLQGYQNKIWKNKWLIDKQNHRFMELSYISFLEPSLERIANEWDMPIEEVKAKLKNLKTHKQEQFIFLEELYDRKDIEKLAVLKAIKADNVRE